MLTISPRLVVRGKSSDRDFLFRKLSLLTPVFLPTNQPPSTLPPECQLGTIKVPRVPHTAQAQPLQGAQVSNPEADFCLTQVVAFNTDRRTDGPQARGGLPCLLPISARPCGLSAQAHWSLQRPAQSHPPAPARTAQPGGLGTSSKVVPGEPLKAFLKKGSLTCAWNKASVSTAAMVRLGWRVCLFCFVLFDFILRGIY